MWTRSRCAALRRVAEHRFIERMHRIERNRIIDKMLHKANVDAEARHAARQAIIDKLLKDALR